MYNVGEYQIYMYELHKQVEKRIFGEIFCLVSQWVQMNLYLSFNVKKKRKKKE